MVGVDLDGELEELSCGLREYQSKQKKAVPIKKRRAQLRPERESEREGKRERESVCVCVRVEECVCKRGCALESVGVWVSGGV